MPLPLILGDMAREWTTMSVHADVYDRIKAHKQDGESFNDVLVRLCDVAEDNPRVS